MCGPTDAQTQIQDEQLQTYKQMQQMTQEMYGKQQSIYGPMAAKFQSIFDMGPSQKGFSADQTNDLNASAVEGTAGNYKNAARALNENIAAQGGDVYSPNGASSQLRGELASSAAGEQSSEESQIKEADYNRGYDEWKNAGAGLMEIAAGDNPLGYANATTGSGEAAASTANTIAQQQNEWLNAAIGAAGAVGGGWASGGFKTHA